LPYLSGLLTASWFISPAGILWHGQTAFFFSFLSFFIILSTISKQKLSQTTNRILLSTSGCFAFFSFISKQSTGIIVFPLYFILLFVSGAPNLKKIISSWISFLRGFLIGTLLFLGWLLVFSDIKIFFRYFLKIPIEFGIKKRIDFSSFNQLAVLLIGRGDTAKILVYYHILFSIVAILMICYYIFNFKKLDKKWKFPFISSVLCLSLLYSQNLFIFLLMDQAENGYAFMGIIFATGIGSLLYLLDAVSSSQLQFNPFFLRVKCAAKTIVIIWLTLSVFLISAFGIKISWSRYVHDIFRKSQFTEYLRIEKLRHLKWGEPTHVGGIDVKADDIINLYNYLKTQDKNFFIFPDFTFFYGILDVPSPQPLVAFYEGLTYPFSYNKDLDEWIVKDLIKNDVEIIIIEEKRFVKRYIELNYFKLLNSFVNNNFIKVKKIGIFCIYERKSNND
jgi:hypothetical protein